MALIKCAKCGRKISDKAAACIGCGAPIRANSTKQAINTKMGKIVVIFHKNPLQVLQQSKLNVVVDNNTYRVPRYKPYEIDLPIGTYNVQMSLPYMGGEIGKANMQVTVNENEARTLEYKPPLTIFNSGTILVYDFKR